MIMMFYILQTQKIMMIQTLATKCIGLFMAELSQ